MADDLGDLIKRYVKEAVHEYFREMWGEGQEREGPFPFWPSHREWMRYRDIEGRFEHNVAALQESVGTFRAMLSAEDWTSRCSEAETITAIKKTSDEVKSGLDSTVELLKRLSPGETGA